jgi:DMSO/TMAO reductase YedYZ molybdopterin-dependent catalytic subunit
MADDDAAGTTVKDRFERASSLGARALRPLHRPLPLPPAALRQGPFRQDAFPSPMHNRYNAAWLGYALGWSFLVCFITGLVSHFAQHPTSWFDLPAHPTWLYRVNQGVHVATGIASIPLLLAKLWTIYPHFWEWPPVRSIANAIERISLLGLVGGAVFELLTGVANIFHWYFFSFFFTTTHYFTAWVLMGSLLIHIGTKITMARDALKHPERYEHKHPARPVATSESAFSRRGFLGGAVATSAAITLVTVGESFSPLGSIDLLAPRKPGVGEQHLPVNQTAREAGVTTTILAASYVLEIHRGMTMKAMSMVDIADMPQHTVRLPITCVEGWSADGTWKGVRLRDILDSIGAPHHAHVRIESLEKGGLYRSSIVNPSHARDPLTLLATHLNGKVLDPDHGYPLRLIAPDRPGVLQTKWISQVVVLA